MIALAENLLIPKAVKKVLKIFESRGASEELLDSVEEAINSALEQNGVEGVKRLVKQHIDTYYTHPSTSLKELGTEYALRAGMFKDIINEMGWENELFPAGYPGREAAGPTR